MPRERADEERELFFSPLLKSPRDPVASATAAWLFNDAQSPWNPITGTPKDKDYVSRFGRRFDAPLLVLPAFRRHLADLLTDRRLAGRVTADGGQQQIELLVGGQWDRVVRVIAAPFPIALLTPGWGLRLRPDRSRIVRNTWDAAVPVISGSRRNATRRWSPLWPTPAVWRAISNRWQWQHSDFLRSVRSSGRPRGRCGRPGHLLFCRPSASRVFPLPYLPTSAKWFALKDDATSQTALDPE